MPGTLTKNTKKYPFIITMLAVLLLVVPAGFAHANFFTDFLYNDVVIGFFGYVMGLGAVILNYALNTFVIRFAAEFGTGAIGTAINQTWAALRDLFNLTFIFGLVYTGFKMILRLDDGQTKRLLINLILAALLVNFSLFITKFVIDFSNILAVEIMDQAPGQFVVTANEVDVTTAMQDAMKIVTVAAETESEETKATDVPMTVILGTLMVFLVGTFVYFSAGILLIIRGAVLVVLMILSPFLFLGMVLPMFKNESAKLWRTLFSRAFFAPLYVTMLYITIQLAAGFKSNFLMADALQKKATEDGADFITTMGGSFGPFIIIAVFLVLSLVIAQKMGAEGSRGLMSAGNSMRRYGQQKLKGGAKWTASRTGGKIAQSASNATGKLADRGLNRLQQIDTRSGNIAQRFAKRAVRSAARSNVAQDTVGGAAAAMQNAKFGNKRTVKEAQKARNATEKKAETAMEFNNSSAPAITPASSEAQITARQTARRQQKSQVARMSNEEIIERATLNPNEVLGPEFASLLTEGQVKALKESGVFDRDQQETLTENKDIGTFADIQAVLSSSNASADNLTQAMEELGTAVSKMSDERLEKMDQSLLTNPAIASKLTDDQINTRRDSGASSAAEINDIRDARRNAQQTIVRDGSLANPASPAATDAAFIERQRRSLFKNAKTAGSMGADVLSMPEASQYLNPKIVEEFLNNNPAQNDIDTLRTQIEDYIINGHNGAPADRGYINSFDRWSKETVSGRQFNL